MDSPTRTRLIARARVIKALAHPSRLLIVEELERQERCVCELQRLIGARMPTVSRHLAILRDAGIVEGDRRGALVYYRLRCPCITDFFGCVEAILQPAPRSHPKQEGEAG